MLPLLAWNLARLGVEDPLRPRLTGTYRHSWAHTQRQLRFLTEALARLHAARVDTLVLKGMALAQQYYPAAGLRPMSDVDVLVPEAQAARAMDTLLRAGFVPHGLRPAAARPQDTIRVRHAHAFRSAGQEIDLHWHILWECAAPDLEADLWQHSVPLRLGAVITRALCPADQLLHVCVHGARWNTVPTFRWLADVVFVLASGARVDWSRVVELARGLGVTLPLRDALALARRELEAPVPTDVLRELATVPVPRWQRLEYALQVRVPTLLSPVWLHAFHHWRQQRHRGVLWAVWRFPQYLTRTFELDDGQLPRFLLSELVRRARPPAPTLPWERETR
jgi:hypothetical protein